MESALACDAPGPLPRRDPTPTTSRTVHRKQGTGLSNRTVKQITGQKKPKTNLPRSGRKKDKLPKQNDTLNILQFNASGLSTKKTELSHFLDQKDIHIALIQETEKGKETDLHISGYTPTHCDCTKCQGTIKE